jgi:hypothetical protein
MAGNSSVYFEHARGTTCREARHRSCAGTWRGEVSIMRDGNRQRRRVNGATKREVQERLDDILDEGQALRVPARPGIPVLVADGWHWPPQ